MKFAAILCLLLASGCHAQFKISMNLKNVTVLEGSNAEIPCSYEASETDVIPNIKWSIKDSAGTQTRVYSFQKGGPITPYPAGRDFSLGENGELQIPGVTINDDKNIASLVCEVDFEAIASEEGELQFNVVALADADPVTTVFANEFAVGDKLVNIGTCLTGKAYPPPKIAFYRGGEKLENEDLSKDSEDEFSDFTNDRLVIGDGDKKAVSMTFNRVVTKEDDNANFYCVVTSGGGDSPETMLVQKAPFDAFRVTYPTDNVKIVPKSEQAFVGKELVLTCEANGYPDPNIEFNGGSVATITLKITKELHNQPISCTARNGEGMDIVRADDYVINALYTDAPTINGETELNYGATLSLTCSVDSRPSSIGTVWKKDGEVVASSAQYTVEKVMFNHAGVYTCETENQYEELNGMVESSPVVVNGLMLDAPDDEDVAGELKKTVDIPCSAMSSPEPTFQWTKKDGTTVEGAKLTMKENNKYVSTLTVGPLDATMSKEEYVCTVINGESTPVAKRYTLPETGSKTSEERTTAEMKPEAASPTAGIIIGILVAILVVAIVVAVLYNKGIICKKGEEKGDENAEDIQPVKVGKEDAEPVTGRPDDVEAGTTEANAEAAEDTQLMNGNDQ